MKQKFRGFVGALVSDNPRLMVHHQTDGDGINWVRLGTANTAEKAIAKTRKYMRTCDPRAANPIRYAVVRPDGGEWIWTGVREPDRSPDWLLERFGDYETLY